MEQQFIPEINPDINNSPEGSITWSSPSNIALVKYWGKHGIQLPANPSISFTLNNCYTTTTLEYKLKAEKSEEPNVKVFLDEVETPSFLPKILKFFENIKAYAPYLSAYEFVIRTTNSFPHSSGIASSASGMSALSLCIMELEQRLGAGLGEDAFYGKASFLSRLGSGSACRSVQGGLMVWGSHAEVAGSSDLYAVQYNDVHEEFQSFQDSVLLVDKGQKQVSSTVGHGLMHNHPYAPRRFEQASENLSELLKHLKSGDLEAFGNLVESEALTLHAMMMTSNPYFILMKPNTLEIINRVWELRKDKGTHLYFTLDAGANVHLLYPEAEKAEVQQFISEQLAQYCENGQYIHDCVGQGPKKE